MALSIGVSCADEPLTRKWVFHYIGEMAIPCFVDTLSHSLTLSGFETDGKGLFFFAGGDSFNLACYQGRERIFIRKLYLPRTEHGIIKLIDDSLYILHDQLSSVIAINKKGRGVLSFHALPIRDISDARIYESSLFTLIAVSNSIKGLDSFSTHRIYLYQWPNTLIADTCVHLDFDENEDLMDSLVMGNYVYTTHSRVSCNTGFYSTYLGQMQSYSVYVWHTNANAGILLVGKNGRPAFKYSIPDVPPLIPLRDDGTVNGHAAFESNNSAILRDNKVFILGYDSTSLEVQVIEVNLNKLLRMMSHGTR